MQSSTELELSCRTGAVAGRQTFECQSSHRLAFVVCSFDEGPVKICSFPLEVGIHRFGTEEHTVDVTAVDVHGHIETVTFDFQLIDCGVKSTY